MVPGGATAYLQCRPFSAVQTTRSVLISGMPPMHDRQYEIVRESIQRGESDDESEAAVLLHLF